MSVKHGRVTQGCLHVCNVVLARPLIVHDVAVFPHFIPQYAVEGGPCLEHAPLILFTNLAANAARELVELVVVGPQSQRGVRPKVVRLDVSHSSGKHFYY